MALIAPEAGSVTAITHALSPPPPHRTQICECYFMQMFLHLKKSNNENHHAG